MTIRVLLADDHAVIRAGVSALLELETDIAVVGVATDGLKLVELVDSAKPDVVVTDLMMPLTNGFEATERIKRAHPEIAVLILSVSAAPQSVLRSLRAGARGYLVKESAGREIADAIRRVHAGGYYLSPEITTVVLEEFLLQPKAAKELSPLESLTIREREVLQLVAEGKTSAEIGELLALSPKTVDTYRSRMMQKLGVSNMVELLHFAVQHGVVDWRH